MAQNKLKQFIKKEIKMWKSNEDFKNDVYNVYDQKDQTDQDYQLGDEVTLKLTDKDNSLLVEPDVRNKISDYWKVINKKMPKKKE